MQPQSILRDPTDRPFIAETMCDVSDLLKMKERGEKEKGGNAPCVRAQVVCVSVCVCSSMVVRHSQSVVDVVTSSGHRPSHQLIRKKSKRQQNSTTSRGRVTCIQGSGSENTGAEGGKKHQMISQNKTKAKRSDRKRNPKTRRRPHPIPPRPYSGTRPTNNPKQLNSQAGTSTAKRVTRR
jgi:hypothetical protein